MKVRNIDDIRRYYPDLLREFEDRVRREARQRRVEERARNVKRLKQLFNLDDGEAQE